MLQTTSQVIHNLLMERSHLVDLIKNLETFLCSQDFTCLPNEQMCLLSEQHDIMVQYNNVLLRRINALRMQEAEEKRVEKNTAMCMSVAEERR